MIIHGELEVPVTRFCLQRCSIGGSSGECLARSWCRWNIFRRIRSCYTGSIRSLRFNIGAVLICMISPKVQGPKVTINAPSATERLTVFSETELSGSTSSSNTYRNDEYKKTVQITMSNLRVNFVIGELCGQARIDHVVTRS
jgi:hypothetical protein